MKSHIRHRAALSLYDRRQQLELQPTAQVVLDLQDSIQAEPNLCKLGVSSEVMAVSAL